MPSRAVACWGIPVMSAPSNQIRPEVGTVSPEIRRKKVVLPAPLGPMIDRSSPRRTLTSTSDTASRLPYARVRRSVRSRTASGIAGECTGGFAVSRHRGVLSFRADMARHAVPTRWKSGMIEIGARVFAYVQGAGIDPSGDTGVANAGLIVGPETAVAVDALMVPSMTKRLVAAIKKTTRRPIAQLINTHHHLDHTGGNRFFRGATIVASEKCREALAPGFPPLPLLQRFMPRFAAEFAKLEVVLPTVTFDDRMVLHDGDREIQLWHPGFAAHTVGDAVAYLPKERILFAGDIAFHYVTPLAFQGHVGNWIKAADRLLRYEADVIVPGHGPIGTRTDLKHMREYLALVRREAKRRFDAGMPAEAAAGDIKLGVYASWSDAERILPNVMRCYQEFRDELDQPMDLPRMLAGMERLRGKGAAHACV
ncbi:MAG: hypothetical protein DMD96_18880 [Candidatus Rokuibacteriota bacterium]|nr:MAG: hypothetical protein DMD96_18880 [Candidatus Rokubacteria bacterium]